MYYYKLCHAHYQAKSTEIISMGYIHIILLVEICDGDSGAPLWIEKENGSFEIVGFVSARLTYTEWFEPACTADANVAETVNKGILGWFTKIKTYYKDLVEL